MNGLTALLPQCIGLVILLGLSGFFSGSETALFSLTRAQVKRLASGTGPEQTITKLLRQPQRLLSTVLVGNMIVNVLFASLIASTAGSLLEGHGVGVAIVVSTSLLLVFGEVTPKILAVKHARAFSRLAAGPLLWFSRLITPARFLLGQVTNGLLFLFGQHRVPGWSALTREEFTGVLAAGAATGATDAAEGALIEHILRLSSVDAHDILVPRTEVIGVSDTATLAAAFAQALQCRHSRLPVYHEDLDDIWGVVSVIDLPRWRGSQLLEQPLTAFREALDRRVSEPDRNPVYPALLVPETIKVEPLLHRMRGRQAHLAVVVDEYGGTAGILTLEDILAEIVGQLSPAEEGAENGYVDLGHAVLADGRTHIRELNHELGLNLPVTSSDTVNGYVMELLGRLPRAGDVAEDDAYRFQVIKMAGRRIGALRVTPKQAAPNGEDPVA